MQQRSASSWYKLISNSYLFIIFWTPRFSVSTPHFCWTHSTLVLYLRCGDKVRPDRLLRDKFCVCFVPPTLSVWCLHEVICLNDVRPVSAYRRSRAITRWTFSIANAMIVARTFTQRSVHEREQTSNKRWVSNKCRRLEATQSCQSTRR